MNDKAKAKEKAEILKQTIIEEEPTSYAIADQIKNKKANKAKKIKIAVFSIIAIIAILFKWLLAPYQASAEYGICRTVLELYVPYPHTIYVSEIKQKRDGSLKLWYTYTDAFGEYRIENFQCKVAVNPNSGMMEILYIKMHKVTLEPDKIKYLNSAMNYFLENPLILNWPAPLPDSLSALHFEFDMFRKVVIEQKR